MGEDAQSPSSRSAPQTSQPYNLINSTCFNLKISQVHVFFRILFKSICFAMTIVKKWYQGLHIPGFPELQYVVNLHKISKVKILY